MVESIDNIRLERIENHLSSLKNQIENNSNDTRMIKTALIGNELSQETGLVHRVKVINEKVHKLEEKDYRNSVYISQLKFVVGIIITLIIGFIFSIILK